MAGNIQEGIGARCSRKGLVQQRSHIISNRIAGITIGEAAPKHFLQPSHLQRRFSFYKMKVQRDSKPVLVPAVKGPNFDGILQQILKICNIKPIGPFPSVGIGTGIGGDEATNFYVFNHFKNLIGGDVGLIDDGVWVPKYGVGNIPLSIKQKITSPGGPSVQGVGRQGRLLSVLE